MTAHISRHALTFQRPEAQSFRDEPRTMLGRLGDRFARLRARHAAFAELHRTADRELQDMGLTRTDIGRIFDPAFAEERADRGVLPVRSRRIAGGW